MPAGVRSEVAGCVVVAAGSGSRLAAERPKAFVDVGGRTMLERSVAAALASGCEAVVAVVPASLLAEARALLGPDVPVIVGGAERQDSVDAGLGALPAEVDVVLVHDAARCLTPPAVFTRVADAVRGGCVGVVPALPVTDTVKQVAPEEDRSGAAHASGAGTELVVGTPDRSVLRAVQTPQGFRREVLERAHATARSAGSSATDDALLLERLGLPVVVVPGDERAFKVTRPLDLLLARALVADEGAGGWPA